MWSVAESSRSNSKPGYRWVVYIAPSENIPATWILSYKPEQTDYLIRLGYEDAKRMLGAHDDR